MLGVPLRGWLGFFGAGLVAGALLLLFPFRPMGELAAFVMIAAAAGIVTVATYARLYARRSWLRIGVRVRRMRRLWQRQGELTRLRARVIREGWPPTELLGRREGVAPP